MEKIIEIHGLRKYYGKFEALKGIDIELYRGEIFGFLGPNGAGKTTTVEILEGLRSSSNGEMIFFGEHIHGTIPSHIKEKIGVVLQETHFLDHLKVREIIELFASFFKNHLSIEKVMELVQIKEKAGAYFDDLSGGQRQRVAIATAIVNDPEIIFLDEPTVGLDPQSRESIWTLIENLKRENKAVFLTTHYMDEAQRLSDRISIIDAGKIITEGTPFELINKYGGKSAVDFKCEPIPADETLKNLNENLSKTDDHFRIKTDNLTKTLEDLVIWSKQSNISLINVSLVEPTLEDVFLSLTGRELRN